ncbi:MAG: EAL domain-containing protein [Actinomycetota bacterium]|nr:EAL domain-containing protein [Actinomycetota bacterium]
MSERKTVAPVHVDAPGNVLTAVVGIGSSAGGLQALTELVAGLVPGAGTAYVVAQHLAPDHPSVLVELLGRATRLAVQTAQDGAVLRPDVVVVAPPRYDIAVEGDRLKVFEPDERVAPCPSVDALFESIARSWGVKGVAVVLSGTGVDGSQGMRSIHSQGGLTIAQAPETARFDSMPRAAIALGGADLVLAAGAIGERLSALGRSGPWPQVPLLGSQPEVLTTVSARLKRVLGIDFSQYKENTLQRQLQRRMAVRLVDTIDDYLPILEADASEAHLLARHLLVTVTSFFRDPEAFAALAARLSELVRSRSSAEQLRVWVPGCATGEELYSLAMLCSEALGRPEALGQQLKIFGTDLDETSLAAARRGVYPLSAAEQIPGDLRAHYTTETAAGLEMSPRLRDCAVFARHNVGENPPFPRMDLVSFRNTLIYFTTPLQDRVLNLLRYSLVPGGLLFLGKSETLGAASAGFLVLDREHKIFEHVADDRSPLTPSRPARPASFATPLLAPRRLLGERHDAPEDHVTLLESLMRAVAQPCLVLDENLDLVEVVGDVSPYCRVPEGPLLTSAGAFLRAELQAEARALLVMVHSGGAPAGGRPIRMIGSDVVVQMDARSLMVNGRGLAVLTFVRVDTEHAAQAVTGERDERLDREFERLERELIATQDSLRNTIAQLEAVNEELETSSEELQAASEELQASNEELEATNEELRATNEELVGLNQLLRARADEQSALNTDLENIQSASNQGMVIVDLDMRVTRFTPLAVRLFALLADDIGAPLLSAPTTAQIPGLEAALRGVLAGEPRCTLEASTLEQSYLVSIAPYQDRTGLRRGAVLTLSDITEVVTLRRTAQRALGDFTKVTNALEEAVWKRDPTMRELQYISDPILSVTGWSAAELMVQPHLLDDGIVVEDRARVQAARANTDAWSVEYRITTRDGRDRWVRESAVPMLGGDEPMVVGTMANISDRVAAQTEASDLSLVFEAVYENKSFGVAVLDADARVAMVNSAFCALVGYERGGVVGRPIFAFGHADEHSLADECRRRIGSDPVDAEPTTHQLMRNDGASVWVTIDVRRLVRPVGDSVAFVIVQDITLLHESTALLSRQARFDESGTGLLNRAAFRTELGRELAHFGRSGERLALIWLDLDRFKEVNDQHGHEAGDIVLRTVAQRLTGGLRAGDLLGRLGGDEFGIAVAGHRSIAELELFLARLPELLSEPIALPEALVTVRGSFGVAFFPDDAVELDALLRSADAAMYAAKSGGGKSLSYFTSDLNAVADERRAMRLAIGAALTKHEFELYYQPVVSATDGSLHKVEALLRWHRDGRVVAAGEFIGFAEESGQIRELGPLTFALLRHDLETLRAGGHGGLPVSVNMSATQLEDRSLTALLSHWPTATGLAGLVVEIVESVFLPAGSQAMAALGALSAQGAAISIDDFGTGFSNLQLLQTLSPTYIKLDKSFLDGEPDSERRRQLLRAAVDIAHSMGALVVAEGVETESQLTMSRDLGVELLQGYLIARPMPVGDLLQWITARNAAADKVATLPTM